jgi:uncharacterized OB-fold protein
MTAIELVGDAARYWEAAGNGQLLIKRCSACEEHFFYPRPTCPFCASTQTEWVAVCGRGTIYSFSLVRKRDEILSAPAFVTLEEGPTIRTGLIGGATGGYAIGQSVVLTFAPTQDQPSAPFFTPAVQEETARGKERHS